MRFLLFTILGFVLALVLWAPANAQRVSYHASAQGGAYNAGTVYSVTGRTRTVLHDFCAHPEWSCPDGAAPLATVYEMGDGSLVGATTAGGAGYNGAAAAGVIYRLTQTSGGDWREDVLYSFCPWFDDCGHYGAPVALWLDDPTTLTGVISTWDGTRGVAWRFTFDGVGQFTWMPLQAW